MYPAVIGRPDMARHGAAYAAEDVSSRRLSYRRAMAGAAGRESEPALRRGREEEAIAKKTRTHLPSAMRRSRSQNYLLLKMREENVSRIVVRPDMARHGAVYAIGDSVVSSRRLSYHPAMAGAAGRESEPALKCCQICNHTISCCSIFSYQRTDLSAMKRNRWQNPTLSLTWNVEGMYLAIVVRPDMARHGAVYAIRDSFVPFRSLSYHRAMAGAAGRESEAALCSWLVNLQEYALQWNHGSFRWWVPTFRSSPVCGGC
jgi:hypothetical protein